MIDCVSLVGVPENCAQFIGMKKGPNLTVGLFSHKLDHVVCVSMQVLITVGTQHLCVQLYYL